MPRRPEAKVASIGLELDSHEPVRLGLDGQR